MAQTPPYVTYTYTRSDSDGMRYTTSVWLRTSDNAALVREVEPRLGPMEFTHPAFGLFSAPCGQEYLADPNPLGIAPPKQHVRTAATVSGGLTTIATVYVGLAHQTEALYSCGGGEEQRPIHDTISLETIGGINVVRWIYGIAPPVSFNSLVNTSTYHDVYRFQNYAFPTTLPDWYFEPSLYGSHADQAPQPTPLITCK